MSSGAISMRSSCNVMMPWRRRMVYPQQRKDHRLGLRSPLDLGRVDRWLEGSSQARIGHVRGTHASLSSFDSPALSRCELRSNARPVDGASRLFVEAIPTILLPQ